MSFKESCQAVEEVIGSLNIVDPEDKQLVLMVVRRALALDGDGQNGLVGGDRILTIAQAAKRLGRSKSTIKWYCTSGQLVGLRTGLTRKLTGVPLSAINAFIAEHSSLVANTGAIAQTMQPASCHLTTKGAE